LLGSPEKHRKFNKNTKKYSKIAPKSFVWGQTASAKINENIAKNGIF
jgi:hypothetical protein